MVVLLNLSLSILVSFISNYFFDSPLTEGFTEFGSHWEAFLLAVVIAPFLETLVLQYAIIETAKKSMSTFFACLLSALIFGLLHFYNWFYFVYAILAGLLLAYLYIVGSLSKNGFLMTLIAHVLHNSTVFILSQL